MCPIELPQGMQSKVPVDQREQDSIASRLLLHERYCLLEEILINPEAGLTIGPQEHSITSTYYVSDSETDTKRESIEVYVFLLNIII